MLIDRLTECNRGDAKLLDYIYSNFDELINQIEEQKISQNK